MITVNGEKVEWREGMTIRDILEEMNYTFPMLVISVNGEVVLRDRWNEFRVPDGAEVKVIHMMAGG